MRIGESTITPSTSRLLSLYHPWKSMEDGMRKGGKVFKNYNHSLTGYDGCVYFCATRINLLEGGMCCCLFVWWCAYVCEGVNIDVVRGRAVVWCVNHVHGVAWLSQEDDRIVRCRRDVIGTAVLLLGATIPVFGRGGMGGTVRLFLQLVAEAHGTEVT